MSNPAAISSGEQAGATHKTEPVFMGQSTHIIGNGAEKHIKTQLTAM